MDEATRYELKATLVEAEAERHDPATAEGHRLVWKALDCRRMAEIRRRGYHVAGGCTRLYRLWPIHGTPRISIRAMRRDGFSHPPGVFVLDTGWLREQHREGRATAVRV